MSETTSTTNEVPRLRQCGRCRETFPEDATADPVALQDWWLCPPCRESLLGATGRLP